MHGKWDCLSPQSGPELESGGFTRTVQPEALMDNSTRCVQMFMLMDFAEIKGSGIQRAGDVRPAARCFVRAMRGETREDPYDPETVMVESLSADYCVAVHRSALKPPADRIQNLCVKKLLEWHTQVVACVECFIDVHPGNTFMDHCCRCVDEKWVEDKCVQEAVRFLDNPRYRVDSSLFTVVLDMRNVDPAMKILQDLVETADFDPDEFRAGLDVLHVLQDLGALRIQRTAWGAIDATPDVSAVYADWKCALCMKGANVGLAMVATCGKAGTQCHHHALCVMKYVASKLDGQDSGLHDKMPCPACKAEALYVSESELHHPQSYYWANGKRRACVGGSSAKLLKHTIDKVNVTLQENNNNFKTLVTGTHEPICFASSLCCCGVCTGATGVAIRTFMTAQTSYACMRWLSDRLRALNVLIANFEEGAPNNLIDDIECCDLRMLGPWMIHGQNVAGQGHTPIRWTLRAMDDVDPLQFTCSSNVTCVLLNMEDHDPQEQDSCTIPANQLFAYHENLG